MRSKNEISEKASLKASVMSGLIWTFGERITAQGVSFILSIFLARILMPEEYGMISMVLVFINIANVFVSNGFGEALIQKREADEEDFSTVFYCSLALSALIYGILYFLAPYIAVYYRQPQLSSVLRVLALKIPIASISTIQHAYVSKNMIFKKFFFSTLLGTLISGIIGIGMAITGYGVWALVAQYLLNTLIDTVVLFITIPWRPHKMFSRIKAKTLIGYSWKLTAASLINTFYVELRSLLIGRKYNSESLAFYNRGNHFPSLVITNVDTAIGKVIFPAMAKTGGDRQKLRQLSRKALKTTSYITFPLLVGLIAIAEPLVRVLLTEKWIECVPFLQLSCVFYMCQPLQTTNWQIIKAAGRSDLCLKLEVLKKCVGVGMIIAAMNHGVYALAVSNAVFGVFSVAVNMMPNNKLIGYSIKAQLIDIFPPLFMSAVMGIAVYACSFLKIPVFMQLVLQILTGALLYVLMSVLSKNDTFLYLLDTIRQMKNHLKR